MDSMVTDEVIKRRLLIDGDGTGEDRRFLVLMKSFVEFVLDKSESSYERETAFRRLKNQLHQIEATCNRTDIAIRSNASAITSFRELKNEIKQEIEDARIHIQESKKLLEEAMRVRKRNMEYDAFARLINNKPDRIQMEAERDKLRNELKNLTNQKEALDRKLIDRRNVLAMLSSLVETLKEQMNEDDDTREHLITEMLTEVTTSQGNLNSSMDLENEGSSQNVPEEVATVSGETSKEKEKYEDLSECEMEQD